MFRLQPRDLFIAVTRLWNRASLAVDQHIVTPACGEVLNIRNSLPPPRVLVPRLAAHDDPHFIEMVELFFAVAEVRDQDVDMRPSFAQRAGDGLGNRRIVFPIYSDKHFVAAFGLSITDKTNMAVAIFTPGRERAGEGHELSGLQNRGGTFAAG